MVNEQIICRCTHRSLGRQQKQALRQSGFRANCAEMLIPTMPWNCQKSKSLTDKWLEDGITGKTGLIGAL